VARDLLAPIGIRDGTPGVVRRGAAPAPAGV